MFWTTVLFVLTCCHVLTSMVRVIEGKITDIENELELAGGSSYRGFELQSGKITVNV